jgi:hypothetical protein
MRASLVAVVSLVAILILPRNSAAQWPPDSLVNLQVLPSDMSVGEVVGVMRGFAGALGVRCIYCHVGDDPNDLASTDFPSDGRVQKRKAREMLRMVQEINGRLLANVPERSDPPVEVTCRTCHRGVTKPVDIRDLLAVTATEHGPDSAIAEYMALREEYYGAGSYDFRPSMLANVAERIARGGAGAALRILEYNEELHPDDQQTYFFTAQLHLRQADTAAAIATLERGLEHLPEQAFFRQMLQRLGGGGG